MSDKEKIKDWVKNLKSQASTIPNLGINALDGFQLACDDVIAFIESISEEPASETIKKSNENQYRLNKRFNEGEKVYCVWYNPQLGKFVVISRFYRENYDQYNIMLCASYEEAIAFAFCMNKALLSPIKERKMTLNHLEELKKQD